MYSLNFMLLGAFASYAHAQQSLKMAPVSFIWPEQRPWYPLYQTAEICGTNGTVKGRTNFPLTGGKIELAVTAEAYNVSVRIAYTPLPLFMTEFRTQTNFDPEIDGAGHQCYPLPDSAAGIEAGQPATIQLEYISTFGGSENTRFFACADVTLVDVATFRERTTCFNATIPEDPADGIIGSGSSSSGSGSSNSSNGLSTGEKFGIAMGIIASLAVGIAIGFFWRKYQRKQQAKKETIWLKHITPPYPNEQDTTKV